MATVTDRLAVLCSVLLLAPSITAADSLRCGNRIVSEGDAIEHVLALCGEPSARQRTWIQRQPRFEYGGRDVPFPGTEEVPVDVWTYDFGPDRLMRRIRFVAGKVESIDTLEHGSSR